MVLVLNKTVWMQNFDNGLDYLGVIPLLGTKKDDRLFSFRLQKKVVYFKNTGFV